MPWLALIIPAVGIAAVSAVLAYQTADALWQSLFPGIPAGDLLVYRAGPRDYLPPAAVMAALTLLSTALGAQLIGRRPWFAAAALAWVTTWLLASGSWLAFEQEALVLAAIWSGTALVAGTTAWSASRADRTAESVKVAVAPTTTAHHGAPLAAVPADEHNGSRPEIPAVDRVTDSFARSVRWAVTAGVVLVLMIIAALIVLIASGGMNLYFFDMSASWDSVRFNTPAMLAPLAIGAAWLTGRTPGRPHARTWRNVILVALAVCQVEVLAYAWTGDVAIPVLTVLGVIVAGNRQRLARRVEAVLAA